MQFKTALVNIALIIGHVLSGEYCKRHFEMRFVNNICLFVWNKDPKDIL